MEVALFVLAILAFAAFATFLFRLVVIFPRVLEKGSLVEKIAHAIRTAFLLSFSLRAAIVARVFYR